jgi:hypothetical protein
MCLADFDRDDFERRLRQLPLPTSVEDPPRVPPVAADADVGNLDTWKIVRDTLMDGLIGTALLLLATVFVLAALP